MTANQDGRANPNQKRRPAAPWMWFVGPVAAAVLVLIAVEDAGRFRDIAAGRGNQLVSGVSNVFYHIGGIAGIYVGWVALAIMGLVCCAIIGWRGFKRWNQK